MTIIPPEDIAQIKQRCEAATPGPWDIVTLAITPYLQLVAGSESLGKLVKHAPASEATALFIAHARTDLPRLLAERDELLKWQAEAIGLLATAIAPASWSGYAEAGWRRKRDALLPAVPERET